MKKILLILFTLIITSCNNSNIVNTIQDNKKKENFSEDTYINFSNLKNYFQLGEFDLSKVIIEKDDINNLIFYIPFSYSHINNNNILNTYVVLLEKDGFEVKLYDGTVVNTFILNKENTELKIILANDKKYISNELKEYMNIPLELHNELIIFNIKNTQ